MWESKNQSRTNCIGAFRNSTVAIEGQLKGYRSRHINYFNSEVYTAGISKDTKKSIGNVAIEGQLKGYRSRHINYFNPEVCTAGISKDTKKNIGNVKDGKTKHFGVPWQLVVARQHNFPSC